MWIHPRQIHVEMKGKFPPTVLPSLYHENVLVTTCHHHSIISTYVRLLCVNIIITGKLDGYFHTEISPEFHLHINREFRRTHPQRKHPTISPNFPRRNKGEKSVGMISGKSPLFPCGNMGDVDGLPAGLEMGGSNGLGTEGSKVSIFRNWCLSCFSV